MRRVVQSPGRGLCWSLLALILLPFPADAGGPWLRRTTGYYRPTAAVVSQPPPASALAPTPMLGTFYPTPYMTVGGNGVVGGAGYTPLQQYGDRAMSLYGPFSSLRAVAAPVTVYTRGYDGVVRPTVGTSFSYPFLPPASPVVYPTRAVQRNAFRVQQTPPWWDTGFYWVDQN